MEAEDLIKEKNYINIPNYLKEYYADIFNIEYYDIRHLIYDIEANLRLLARFHHDTKLKDIV